MPNPTPRPGTKYRNDHVLYSWYAKEIEAGSTSYYQQTKYVSMPLREARIESTNAFIGPATAPLYDVAQNRIEWAAGTAPAGILLPCAGLQLLIDNGFNSIDFFGIFSKSSNLDSIVPVSDQKLNTFILGGSPPATFTSTLDTEEEVTVALISIRVRRTTISSGSVAGIIGGQFNSFSLNINANPSDEVRLHAFYAVLNAA